jgi:phosphopantetheine adenylyltransferase
MEDEIVKASYNRKVKYLKRRSKALKRVLRGKFKKAMDVTDLPSKIQFTQFQMIISVQMN